MNTEKYDLLKDELKVVHFETDRLFIRNYIDADENGFLTIFLCIADKSNNTFIGYVLLNKYPEEQESAITLGCSLIPECQSKGYGYEAIGCIITELKNSSVTKKILANAYTYNESSLGLIKKLGFTSIGTINNEEYFILDI